MEQYNDEKLTNEIISKVNLIGRLAHDVQKIVLNGKINFYQKNSNNKEGGKMYSMSSVLEDEICRFIVNECLIKKIYPNTIMDSSVRISKKEICFVCFITDHYDLNCFTKLSKFKINFNEPISLKYSDTGGGLSIYEGPSELGIIYDLYSFNLSLEKPLSLLEEFIRYTRDNS